MLGLGTTTGLLTAGTFNAYVANEFADTVSVVAITGRDGGTETVIATIDVGIRPIGTVATPDGQKVYVGNSDSNSVSVIDTGSNTVIKTITGVTRPMGEFAVHPDGSRVYIGSGSNHIFEIDTATDTVVGSFPQGFHGPPVGLAITQEGQFLYATSSWSPTSGVSKIRLSDKAIVAGQSGSPIQSNGPIGLTLYNSDTLLLVAMCGFSFDFNKDTCNGAGPVPLVELNTSDLSVSRVLNDSAFGALNSIAVTEDETRAYVVDSAHGDVIHVIDLASFTRVDGVQMSSHPRAITKARFGPGKEFLYVPDSDHGWLAKIDGNPTIDGNDNPDYNTVVGTTDVGTYPRSVAIANTHRPEAFITSVDDTVSPLRAEMEIFDDEGHDLSGAVNLYAIKNPFPDGLSEIRLEILRTRCSRSDEILFFFGDMASGTLIDTIPPAANHCTCEPPFETHIYTDPAILDLHDAADGVLNQFHVHRDQSSFGVSAGTTISWMRVVLTGPDQPSRTYCAFDFDGGNCTETNLCTAQFDHLNTIHSDVFIEDAPTLLLSEAYSDSTLPRSLDLSGLDAGVFTLELTTTDGTASVRTQQDNINYDGVCFAFLFTPPTPEAGAEVLTSDIEQLVTAGTLNSGEGNSLTSRLDAAVKQLDRGNGGAAINQIQAFINQVNALIMSKRVTPEEGQLLIGAASVMIGQISNS